MSTTTKERAGVPFGARGLQPACTVTIDPATFRFDPERQLNLLADGSLWAHTPVAKSSTATNRDTKPGNPPDENSDPYAFPGDEVA
jgi:putative ATP-grasp target RiPP